VVLVCYCCQGSSVLGCVLVGLGYRVKASFVLGFVVVSVRYRG